MRRPDWFACSATLYVLLLYAGSGGLGRLQVAIADFFGPIWPWVPGSACLIFLTAVALAQRRKLVMVRGGWLLLLLGVVAAYGISLLTLEVPAEKIHLVQYGLLAWLVTEALAGRFAGWRLHGLSLALVIIAGIGDELIQWLRPNRVGDLRDVAINTLAGVLAQLLLAVLRQLRNKGSGEGEGQPAEGMISCARGGGRPIPPDGGF